MGWFDDVMSVLFPSKPAPSPVVPLATDSDVLDALNEQRTKRGLGPLKLDSELSDIARNWAGRMADDGRLYHGDFAGRIAHVFPNTSAGEDIAEGQPTVAAVVAAWMASLPHRANILGSFTLLGVGKATARGGEIYWVVDFDRPDSSRSPHVAA